MFPATMVLCLVPRVNDQTHRPGHSNQFSQKTKKREGEKGEDMILGAW